MPDPTPNHVSPIPPDKPFIRDWVGWWFDTRCSCGRSTELPGKLLCMEGFGNWLVADFVPKLRCSTKTCRKRPRSVVLVDRIQPPFPTCPDDMWGRNEHPLVGPKADGAHGQP